MTSEHSRTGITLTACLL